MSREIIQQLCSSVKLERDQAIFDLNKILPTLDETTVREFKNVLVDAVRRPASSSWESKYGCLSAAKAVISYADSENEFDKKFTDEYTDIALRYLSDDESRVRIAAGEVLGTLCAKRGPSLYSEIKETLFNLLLNQTNRRNVRKIVSVSNSNDASKRRDNGGVSTILETTLKCLQNVVEGCGYEFQPFVDSELLSLVFQSTQDLCTFIREAGFYLCASLIASGENTDTDDFEERENIVLAAHGKEFARHLSDGLSDNWSQVRLAASVATRKFLMGLSPTKSRQVFYPDLLPKICLNRYYVAEGVRNYSQETWRQVTGSDGKMLVEKFIDQTVDYYVSATQSENHPVREAACSCIAELATKIDSERVRPHVERVLSTLGICFQDDSWPVRDAACLACGSLIRAFPKESEIILPNLYPMFYRNLEDPIASVRQGAAIGLSSIVRGYGSSVLPEIREKIITGLTGVKNQPDSSLEFSEPSSRLNTNYTTNRRCPNVVDPTNDVPIGKNGRRVVTNTDYATRRDSEPWELADGCIHLLGELAIVGGSATPVVIETLPLLAEISKLRHYSDHLHLLENLCKTLPIICSNIGKKQTKAVIRDFFDSIFYALDSENALTSSAASQCLNTLSSLIGPSILRAKVQSHNSSYLHHLDANIYIAPL